MVAELKKVGFLDDYLNSLALSGELEPLYDAHMALGARDLVRAQHLLDQLNPLALASAAARPLGWAQEAFEKHPALFDFARNPGDLMAAQRQLLAYHAGTIGGDYAKLLRYKPYKTNALSQAEDGGKGSRYFDDQELRDWPTIEEGDMQGAPLTDAINAAKTVGTEDDHRE